MIKIKETKGKIEAINNELFIGNKERNLRLNILNFKNLENNCESESFICLSVKGKIKH